MKMKSFFKTCALLSIVLAIGCGKSGPAPANPTNPEPEKPEGPETENSIEGDLSVLTLEEGKTYTVVGDLVVPEGKNVVIPAGARFEFDLGPRNQAWVLDVHGSLYVEGKADSRVVFTASEAALASGRDIGYGGLWGGIAGGRKAGDIVIEYADILHAGGVVRAGTIISTEESGGSGRLSPGSYNYALYYCRPSEERQDGVFVLLHSRIAYTVDDAIRTNGGKTLIAYNTFEVIGQTGGEAVNIKAGGSGDYAFNLFYNIATNALKSADTQAGRRGSLETNFYNNTIVGSGFRRTDAGRGGSLNYEQDAYGKAYNNLIVNCRYGLRLNAGEDEPRKDAMEFGYNWYYGQVAEVVDNFYPTGSQDPSRGLIGTEFPIPTTDKIGGVGENNPDFVNYNVSSFAWASRANNNPLPSGADFRLKAGSPAASGAKTDFEPKFARYTTLRGKNFDAPKPAAHFGAYAAQ